MPRADVRADFPSTVSGWPLRIERPATARMKLALGNCEVLFVWPERVPRHEAQAFFDQHQAWLQRTVRSHRRIDDRARADLAFDPRWPGRVPWFGQLIPIHFEDGAARLTVGSDSLLCRLPLDRPASMRTAQRLLIAGLSEALTTRLRQWLPAFESRVGRRAQGLRIRAMRSLWGSLSPQGAITMNLALAFADESVAEYVLAHEMAHFLEHGHGPRFWAVVDALHPEHHDARRLLAREHRYLQALLGRLSAPVATH
jgi:hypothetical protein